MRLQDLFEEAPLSNSNLLEMRTDSSEFDRLDSPDKWLAKYTYENLDKWPSDNTLKILVKRYPIIKPMTVYRGMNFSTKSQWDEFNEKLSTGSLTFGGITSWGRDKTHVEQFAVTKPSYGLNLATMQEYSAGQKEKEYVNGYRGVVIETNIDIGQAIDVNASKLGHEDELILLPGTYQVKITRHLKKYKDSVADGDLDINSAILKPDDSSEYSKGFKQYVLHHHTKDLSDQARKHLFNEHIQYAKSHGGADNVIYTQEEPSSYFDTPDTMTKGYFSSYSYQFFYGGINGEYLPEDDLICRKYAKRFVTKAIKIIKEHPDDLFIYIDHLSDVVAYADLKIPFLRAMKEHISAQYKQSEQDGRKINDQKFKDSWEFQSVIIKHAEKVAKILSQTPSFKDKNK